MSLYILYDIAKRYDKIGLTQIKYLGFGGDYVEKRELVNKCIDYIMQHLDEDLTLDTVANHFHYSKFYFSRVFKEETGESVYAFIKRCKVDQSAIDMKLNPGKTISAIGADFGYCSSNYSALFKQRHTISPAAFRKATNATSVSVPFGLERTAYFKTYEEYAANIRIEEMEDCVVLYERYIGNYEELAQNWYHFIEKHDALIGEKTVLIERFYNDPSITNRQQCICDTCITVEPDCELGSVTKIAGGRYAVFRYKGFIEDIFETLQGIFSVWLPQSGYEMGARFGLNIYNQINWENRHVVMDLCIPIK